MPQWETQFYFLWAVLIPAIGHMCRLITLLVLAVPIPVPFMWKFSRTLLLVGLLSSAAFADGINTSGNVGNGPSAGVGQHEGILIPGGAVSFTPPVCTNSLNFVQSCNSQYLLLGMP